MFPLHALLFSLRVMMVYTCFIACYYAPHKQTPVQLHELQIFTRFFASTSLHFVVKNLGDSLCTDLCHQQMFTQDHLNSTSGYQLHVDSTILQYNIFNSTTVFFAKSFAWASLPGLNLNASYALTKLSSPTRHHGIR